MTTNAIDPINVGVIRKFQEAPLKKTIIGFDPAGG